MSVQNNTNEELIHYFYTCFKNKDYKGMQNCYSKEATFSDEVFINLDSLHVKAMWEMLCKRGKDLQLEYKNVKVENNNGSAEWIATYTFTTTGKKVVNNINAKFQFNNGLIVKHNDTFNFYKWARQAFGLTGALIGWTSFFKNKVRDKAKANLSEFIK